MMRFICSFVGVLAAFLHEKAVECVRTAVILEFDDKKDLYSTFFKRLEERGHELSFHNKESLESLTLEKYGDLVYENLIIFYPNLEKEKLPSIQLLNFIENGGNVLLGASDKLGPSLRAFALECGVEFEKKGSLVMDHFNYIQNDQDVFNSVITAVDMFAFDRVIGSHLAQLNATDRRPVAFHGVGMSLEESNILGFHVLKASDTAYSFNPRKAITKKLAATELLHGAEIGLVTAIQARNNARVVFFGSLDMFENKFFTEEFSNENFTVAVSKWNFQEAGVLKMSNIRHHRQDGSFPDRMLKNTERPDQPVTLYPDAEIARDSLVYRIKDNLTYSMDIFELQDQKWVPYQADDVQLEFVMLDPYVRKSLTHDSKGHFSVTFQAPDQYGIYLFRVMYQRHGLTTLSSNTQVSVRPFKHDEYERFIPTAYPYYLSAFSMMAGVFIFSMLFLFNDDSK